MKIRPERITIKHNGIKTSSIKLNAEEPTAVLYIENSDFAMQLAAGLTAEENAIEAAKRSIIAFFEVGIETLEALEKICPEAAADINRTYFAEEETEEAEPSICLPHVKRVCSYSGPAAAK